jgi:hypothetical protein
LSVQNDIKGWESRYIGSFFGIASIFFCVYLLKALDGATFFRKILRFFGQYSLEIYLLHILMWEFMGVAAGVIEPQGLLPLQMPKDMHTVERQKEDLPFDMECYKDADGNVYDFAYGLNWSGVIRDWRTEKYAPKR